MVRSFFYDRGLLKTFYLDTRVISVGNIAMGGTGKTPMVEKLICILKKHNIKAAVISRGYKGNYKESYKIVSDGKKITASPSESGDEPYLLAYRNPGTPVIVSAKRYIAGKIAEKMFSPDVIILDDAFQHMALARNINIVLINAEDPFGKGIFPAGLRREPLFALKRADAIIITKAKQKNHSLEKKLKKYSKAPVFTCRYTVTEITEIYTEEKQCSRFFAGKKVGAFAALANTESFFSMLEKENIKLLKRFSLPDHYEYSNKTFKKVSNALTNCDIWLTTEKDAVKIRNNRGIELKERAIYVVKITHDFMQPELFTDFIKENFKFKLQPTPIV